MLIGVLSPTSPATFLPAVPWWPVFKTSLVCTLIRQGGSVMGSWCSIPRLFVRHTFRKPILFSVNVFFDYYPGATWNRDCLNYMRYLPSFPVFRSQQTWRPSLDGTSFSDRDLLQKPPYSCRKLYSSNIATAFLFQDLTFSRIPTSGICFPDENLLFLRRSPFSTVSLTPSPGILKDARIGLEQCTTLWGLLGSDPSCWSWRPNLNLTGCRFVELFQTWCSWFWETFATHSSF